MILDHLFIDLLSRREDALRDRSRRHESAHTSLFTPLALSQQLRVYSRTRIAGPPPPRSWAYPANTSPASGVSSPGALPDSKWRARALGWILMHIDHPDLIPHAILRMHVEEEYRADESVIPTLREMCVQSLMLPAHGAGSHQPTLHDRALDSDLPAHLRKFIVRYFAIHFPLPWSALGELWGIPYGEQGADGEVILVGESAGGSKISGSAIKDILTPSEPDFDTRSGDTEEFSWDADEFTSAPPLKTLISVAHPLSKHISSLPPTITHLALIAIPLDQDITPRGLMAKLSGRLRLLEVLDLSCNSWLGAHRVILMS